MQHRDLFRLALPLLLVACAGAPLAEPAEVSLRIDGFLKSEGIT